MLGRSAKGVLACLVAGLLVACSPEPPEPADYCSPGMSRVSAALEQYQLEHAGRGPTQLSELVPVYLSKIPKCEYLGAEPHYTLSPDRRWFGLDCSGDHISDDEWPPRILAVGMASGYSPRFALAGHDKLDSRGLLECASKVEAFRNKHGRMPSNLGEVDHAAYGNDLSNGNFPYALCSTADGGYQILRLAPDALGEGVAPLQPRYDSRTGGVTARRLVPLGPRYRWTLDERLCYLLLTLGFLAWAYRVAHVAHRAHGVKRH